MTSTPLKSLFATSALAFAASALLVPHASADTRNSDAADAALTQTSAGDAGGGGATITSTTGATATVGRVTGLISGLTVLPFALPTLPEGQMLSNASFTFTSSTTVIPNFNTDLYGLGFRTTSTVLTTDSFIGAFDTTDATLIQNDFVSTTSSLTINVAFSTNAVGGQALTAYLNAQYTAGAVGGNFVFLRLNPDTFTTSANNSYGVRTADGASTFFPVISFDVVPVPEPSTAVMLVMGAGFTLLRRRRQNA